MSKCFTSSKMNLSYSILKEFLISTIINVMPLTTIILKVVSYYPTSRCMRYCSLLTIRNNKQTRCITNNNILTCCYIPNNLLTHFCVTKSCFFICIICRSCRIICTVNVMSINFNIVMLNSNSNSCFAIFTSAI